MRDTTLDGSIYLLELASPDERLEFQYMPRSFEWNRVGNYAKFPIVGRNNSRKQLTGGEDTLSFQLNFNSLFEENKQECLERMAWLQSLTANDGNVGPVRNVALSWGTADIFRNKIWVVKSVRAVASDFNSNFGYVPTEMFLDVVLELDPDENTRINDIRVRSIPVSGNARPKLGTELQ